MKNPDSCFSELLTLSLTVLLHFIVKCMANVKLLLELYSLLRGLNYITLQIHNVQKMDRLHSKINVFPIVSQLH
jgi:hypothetical protein